MKMSAWNCSMEILPQPHHTIFANSWSFYYKSLHFWGIYEIAVLTNHKKKSLSFRSDPWEIGHVFKMCYFIKIRKAGIHLRICTADVSWCDCMHTWIMACLMHSIIRLYNMPVLTEQCCRNRPINHIPQEWKQVKGFGHADDREDKLHYKSLLKCKKQSVRTVWGQMWTIIREKCLQTAASKTPRAKIRAYNYEKSQHLSLSEWEYMRIHLLL